MSPLHPRHHLALRLLAIAVIAALSLMPYIHRTLGAKVSHASTIAR